MRMYVHTHTHTHTCAHHIRTHVQMAWVWGVHMRGEAAHHGGSARATMLRASVWVVLGLGMGVGVGMGDDEAGTREGVVGA